MTYQLTWLPSVLRAAGLTVVEEPGWESRGHGDMGVVKGAMCHHTAGCLHESDLSMTETLIHGRPGLDGPLSQLGLNEKGVYYMIAAGRCWHAGPGEWQGITAGNSSFIGIEAANTGLGNDEWEAAQMEAYAKGCAAILKHIGAKPIMCVGHKEYATPKGRKIDPTFSMPEFRVNVANLMGVSVE